MFYAIKPFKLNQSKKQTTNQGDKFKKELKRIQSFFKQHKTFLYDKNENKNKKNDRRNNQRKKYCVRKRFTRSSITGPNMMKDERQQDAFKKKIKCYNCQKLKHYVNDCSESDHKQQKNIKK